MTEARKRKLTTAQVAQLTTWLQRQTQDIPSWTAAFTAEKATRELDFRVAECTVRDVAEGIGLPTFRRLKAANRTATNHDIPAIVEALEQLADSLGEELPSRFKKLAEKIRNGSSQ